MKDKMKAFFNQPFNPGGTTLDWFLFLGLLIVLMTIWKIIIIHVTDEV